MTRKGARSDDSGAALIAALIFVAVVSVVVAVVLSLADSSLRTTVALRGQAADAASADGAAQIAINELRHGSYDAISGQCFGATDTLVLSDFYVPPSSSAHSAAVTCEPDLSTSGDGLEYDDRNKPADAVLTLGSSGGEAGLYANDVGGREVKVEGGIFSNSTITVAGGSLVANGGVAARGACTGTITATLAPTCALGPVVDPRGDDPDYPPPTAGTPVQPVPICVIPDQLVTFTPGLYTDIFGLNNLTRCRNGIFHFRPGVYYFNLPAATPWLIDQAYVVGGTPTAPLVAGTPPTIPGSCQSPTPPSPPTGWSPPVPNSGVQFVLGGGTQIVVRRAQVELCGSYSSTGPPIVVYGLKSSVGPVPAQSGCTLTVPYPLSGCAAVIFEGQANSKLHIQGTAYLPRTAVDLAVNNTGGPVFSAGVIARTVRLTPTAGANLAGAVIALPNDSPPGRRTVVYLNVYVCPGASTCSPATGANRLRAKVGILDTSGTPVPGRREITIYSWSVLR
jgi:hypothetical protein